MKLKKVVALLLTLTLVLGMIPTAFATNDKGVTYTATLDKQTLTTSDADQEVVVTVDASSKITWDGIGAKVTVPEGLELTKIENKEVILAAADYNLKQSDGRGSIGFDSASGENEEIQNICVLTYKVPANTPAGEYKLGIEELEITSDYGEIWERNGTAYATLSIEAPAPTGPKIPLTLSGYEHGKHYSFEAADNDVQVTTTAAGVTVASAIIELSATSSNAPDGYLVGGKQYYLRVRVESADSALASYTAEDLALGELAPFKIDHYSYGGKYAIEARFALPAVVKPEGLTNTTFSVEGYEIGKAVADIVVTRNDFDVEVDYSYVVVDMNYTEASGNFKANTDYWLVACVEGYVVGDEDQVTLVGLMETPITGSYDASYGEFMFKLPQLQEAAPATYGITVNDAENGSVAADKDEAAEGDTVTLTVTPADGYELDTLTYTEEGGSPVDIKEAKSFTMPAKAVTVAATFKAVPSQLTFTLSGYELGKPVSGKVITRNDTGATVSSGVYLTYKFGTKTLDLTSGNFMANTVYSVKVRVATADVSGDPSLVTLTLAGVDGDPLTATVTTSGSNTDFTFALPKLTPPADANITIAEMSGGMIEPSTFKANAGDTVTLTQFIPNKNPEKYYTPKPLSVTVDGSDTAVSVTRVNDTTYTFVMPEGKVTVSATFVDGRTKWTVGSVSGSPGETVKVPVTVSTGIAKANAVQLSVPSVYYGVRNTQTNKYEQVFMENQTVILGENAGFSSLTQTQADQYANNYITDIVAEGVDPNNVSFYITFTIPQSAPVGQTIGVYVNIGSSVTTPSAMLDANKTVLKVQGDIGSSESGIVTVVEAAAPATYGITVNAAENGTVTADKAEAAKGDTVTLTVTPAEGYELDNLTVVDAEEKAVTVTNNTFVMPDSAVTVSATFKAISKTKYLIAFEDNDDGYMIAKVNGVEVTEAAAGETVTLVPMPEEGYEVSSVEVLNLGNVGVNWPVEKQADGNYTFTMPNNRVNITIHFVQSVTDGAAAAKLGDLENVMPGDVIKIPVTFTNPPAGSFAMVGVKTQMPEGWEILGVENGPDNRVNLNADGSYYGTWHATNFTVGNLQGWGLSVICNNGTSAPLPEGTVMYFKVQVPVDAEAREYQLDMIGITAADNGVDADYVGFGNCLDGHATVCEKPNPPIKLNAPELLADHITTCEDMIEVNTVLVSAQETNAVMEFSWSANGTNWSDWVEGTVGKNLATGLAENTKYYVRARYKAANTACYENSDPTTVEVTTKANVIDGPIVIKLGTEDIAVSVGDTFTIPVIVESHDLGDMKFRMFRLAVGSTEQFKMVAPVAGPNGRDAFNSELTYNAMYSNSGNGYLDFFYSSSTDRVIGIGKYVDLTFQVKEGTEPGEYTIALPTYYDGGYRLDACGYMLHLRGNDNVINPAEYQINSVTITVTDNLNAPELTEYTATDDSITVTAPDAVEGATVQYAISTKANETKFDWRESNVFTGLDEETTYYVYARYRSDDHAKAGDSAASTALEVKTVNPTAEFTVSSASAPAGETVEIKVSLNHTITKNAKYIVLTPAGDLAPTAKAGSAAEAAGWEVSIADGEVMLFHTTGAVPPTGEILVLTYKIPADAAVGTEYVVNLSNISFAVEGTGTLRAECTVTEGKVTVGAAPTYSITVGNVQNGTVEVSSASAKAGETITVTATPATGYELDKITVNGTNIEGNTFEMPANNVEVSATFTAISYTVTMDSIYWGAPNAAYDSDYVFGSTEFGAVAPVVTMGGGAVTVTGISPWTIESVTGNIVITAPKFDVTFTGDAGITLPENGEATYGTNYTFTIPTLADHTISYTITIGEQAYADATENGSEVTIPGAALIGDVAVNFTKQADSTECDHSYGTVSYRWSSDNSTCTAVRTCSKCTTPETETVETTCVTNADGSKTYTAVFTNDAFATQTKTVAAPVVYDETIRVTFRLIGDGEHSNGVKDHDEYVTWIPTTSYTVDADDTVYDVFVEAMADYGLSFREGSAAGGYITSIKAPSVLGGYWLGEFDNGPKSGWMYTLNGKDADAVKKQTLSSGDAIVFHYTDDYSLETVSGTYNKRWLEAKDITPEKYVELYGKEEDKKDETIEFVDVKESDWFYDEVQFAVTNGLFNGVGNDKFDPNGSMTRAMLVTVLYRLEGEPTVRGTSPFTDVSNNIWYTDAVIWAEDNAIVNGVGDNKFDPNSSITREQMATVLFRYAQYKKYDTSASNGLSKYSDFSDISAYALNSLKWANAEGLITGRTTTILAPKGTATRAEVAAILYRFVENVVNK